MGCCNSTNNFSPDQLDQKIQESIKSGNSKALSYYISLKSKLPGESFDINTTKLQVSDSLKMTIPGLCLLEGSSLLLKSLIDTCRVDFEALESSLSEVGTSTLAVICEINSLYLFEIYCQAFVKLKKNANFVDFPSAKSCFFSKKEGILADFASEYPDAELSPVHIACLLGNLTVLKAISNFSKSLSSVPNDLNLNYVERVHGFNCALLACKSGNYNTIKFLFNSCKADFNHLNAADENSLQVLFASAKTKSCPELYNCLIYLVDKVKVDISHNYEDVLVYCDAFKTADYFIKKLEEIGIQVDREFLKKKYGMFRQNTYGSFAERYADLRNQMNDEPESPKEE
jgi:hypothetical protein